MRRPLDGEGVSAGEELRWRQKVNDLKFNQLERVQSHAEQWRNGLTGLTALFAVVAIAKGRQSFSDLTDTGRLWAIALLAIAFLLLLSGSLLAMRASFGDPKKIWLDEDQLRAWEAKELETTRQVLRAAKVVFLAGVVCVAVATGITWINAKPSPPAFVQVRLKDQSEVCGALKAGSGSTLTVEPSTEPAIPIDIPLSHAERVRIVANCPKPT